MTAMQHHRVGTAEDVRSYVMDFEQIGSRDLGRVGGKNPIGTTTNMTMLFVPSFFVVLQCREERWRAKPKLVAKTEGRTLA